MKDLTLHYIGKKILLKSIRDFILDNSLGENDSIILNKSNYDEIILEYRETYFESMIIPYYLLSVLIKEDRESSIPKSRVGFYKNDPFRYHQDYNNSVADKDSPDNSYVYETIYRCGWCGNVVDYDGSEFSPETRQFKINIHKKFKDTIVEKRVNGGCCPNGDQN